MPKSNEIARHRYTVTLEGGEPFDVFTSFADQTVYEQTRQRRKWPMIAEGGVNYWVGFTAWLAAKRAGRFDGTYEAWTAQVTSFVTYDEEDEDTVDPTSPDQPPS